MHIEQVREDGKTDYTYFVKYIATKKLWGKILPYIRKVNMTVKVKNRIYYLKKILIDQYPKKFLSII